MTTGTIPFAHGCASSAATAPAPDAKKGALVDNTTVIRIFAGLIFLLVVAGFLVLAIFYLSSLSKLLGKCSPAARTMQPAMVWLMFIPVFNIVWHFFVVLAIATTVANEYRLRNLAPPEREPGKAIGISMCVCAACSFIPFLGILTGLAHFVLWILYWIKVNEFSRGLDATIMVRPAYGVTGV